MHQMKGRIRLATVALAVIAAVVAGAAAATEPAATKRGAPVSRWSFEWPTPPATWSTFPRSRTSPLG